MNHSLASFSSFIKPGENFSKLASRLAAVLIVAIALSFASDAFLTPGNLLNVLRQASLLGARGHLAAASAFEAGASEFEIELAFLAACGQREQELPYNPIIALNEGGAVLRRAAACDRRSPAATWRQSASRSRFHRRL